MSEVPVRPASTVVVLRDGPSGLEVLLVRRNRALAFAGGFWVFPGGAVDEADREKAGGDPDVAARYAAAREAEEEAGITMDPGAMVLVRHWTTPAAEKKRFSTWFYACSVPTDTDVVIDNSEIHDYRWAGIREALEEHGNGELNLMPPTYITLRELERYDTAAAAVEGERETPCPRVLPLMIKVAEREYITVYPGDAAYSSGNHEAEGPRHRAYIENGGWRYQYEGCPEEMPLFVQD